MNAFRPQPSHRVQGLLIRTQSQVDAPKLGEQVLAQLQAQDLTPHVLVTRESDAQGHFVRLRLNDSAMALWAPEFDTLSLCDRLSLDAAHHDSDLQREIVLTLLMGPVAFEFPSMQELLSAVRIRHNIVHAARKTTLAFHTSEAERPADCWHYKEDTGFTLLPDVPLVSALIKATQPEVSGTLFSFSCYRATEYVMLLGIAQELVLVNPAMQQQLQTLWEHRAVASGEFHDVFLREQGSMDAPLPPHYFVPGDRTWFRNPDEASADAEGFEGSWVMYLGGGLFNNFWKREQPFTLTTKCVELYHWRHALYTDDKGYARIDENKVATLVEASLKNPQAVERIMAEMVRYREPRGVYTDAGGCIDTTREFARWVHPGTSDLVLPES
jgi:Protein-glutamine gamma-glutamyltransferase